MRQLYAFGARTSPSMGAIPERVHFLDGMRGWAALAVVLYHLAPTFLIPPHYLKSIGWLMLPMDGALAVYVFFVVSGFSLSIGFVRRRERSGLFSLAIRRYPRLAIPVLAATLITLVMLLTGANRAPNAAALLGRTNWPASAFRFEPGLIDALKFGLFDVFFHYRWDHSYNPVLWTMSYELIGSVMVFALLIVMGTSRIRWAAYGLGWLALAHFDSPLSSFIAGTVLAECHGSIWIRVLRKPATAWLISTTLFSSFSMLSASSGRRTTVLPCAPYAGQRW
ncbi:MULTISPECIES: acyltransferase family protein [unclassified Caballeronia]|uniref:acyltransferase family protein n=1 Tax=unclassified Caballeronia TaxID=2646786 RepID=UPI002028013D|nr:MULTISPECIES: acyltransferase family protein [unclassified Caballeronia]